MTTYMCSRGRSLADSLWLSKCAQRAFRDPDGRALHSPNGSRPRRRGGPVAKALSLCGFAEDELKHINPSLIYYRLQGLKWI